MNIETKEVDNKKYYYLKHSSRENNKIITKKKYLGTKVPSKLDNIKKEFYREINSKLFEEFRLIKEEFQKHWAKIPKSVKKRELEEIAIAFTYNTNAIEGSTITLRQTREILQFNTAPNKPIDEIEETKKHAEIFFEILKKKEIPNIETLKKWHYGLFKNTKKDIAGKFRDYNVLVGDYLAPEPEEMNKMLIELGAFLEKNDEFNPIEFSARVHYIFEKIHPFGDGNGRIGRLLMNIILWMKGYPIVIIENKKKVLTIKH